MKVLVLYVVLVAIGGFIAYQIGAFVERNAGSTASLIVFLALFFANFIVAWMISVRIVERFDKSAA